MWDLVWAASMLARIPNPNRQEREKNGLSFGNAGNSSSAPFALAWATSYSWPARADSAWCLTQLLTAPCCWDSLSSQFECFGAGLSSSAGSPHGLALPENACETQRGLEFDPAAQLCASELPRDRPSP